MNETAKPDAALPPAHPPKVSACDRGTLIDMERKGIGNTPQESERRFRLSLENILAPEGEFGEVELGEIVDTNSLQALVNVFYQLTGMPMGLLDLKGRILVGVGWQDICTKFHRVNPESCRNCVESDLQLSADVPPGQYKIYRCKNHMWDVATPIMIGDKQFGNLFMGQFFFEDEPIDFELFRAQAARYGFPEAEYLAALDAVPRLSREALHTSMTFFIKLAEMTSKLSYSNLKLARSLAERDTLLASLNESEQRLQLFIEHAPAALAMFDTEMRYLSVSRRWLSDYGLGERNLAGLCHYDVFPEIGEQWREAHRRALEGAVLRVEADRFEPKDGSVQWVRWEVRPWHHAGGDIGGIVIFTEDVTESKQAEDILRRYELLAGHSRDIILFMRADDGRILSANAAAEQAYGYSQQELLELGIKELRAPEELDVIDRQLAHADSQGLLFETLHRRKDGSVFPVEVSSQGATIGGSRTLISVIRDITDRRRREEELCEAKEAAEAATRTKSQFLANMSHELRTPMTGVLGMLDLVSAGELEPEQREHVDAARTSARSLVRILNDILDLTKIEMGKLSIEERPFAVRKCVEETFNILLPVARSKGIELTHTVSDEVPNILLGDQMRLNQVLTNLAGNAVKFTEKGKVEIRVSAGEGGPDGRRKVTFTVADTGIGIPREKQKLLFRVFSQVDESHSRSYGGTGLGLAISREIVERMGGNIFFASQEGIGSTFTFSLPFLPGQAAEESAPVAETLAPAGAALSESAAQPHLLVAEDDAIIRQVLGSMLQRARFAVDFAENGEQVVEMWRNGGYDLILMDVQMPRTNGFQATAAIREEERTRGGRIPIVAMTAHALREDQEKCLAVGMDAYLTKPIDFMNSLETIKRMLARK